MALYVHDGVRGKAQDLSHDSCPHPTARTVPRLAAQIHSRDGCTLAADARRKQWVALKTLSATLAERLSTPAAFVMDVVPSADTFSPELVSQIGET